MSDPISVSSRTTSSDAVAFAKAVSDAGAANQRIVVDHVNHGGGVDSTGNTIEASVTWHTEDRGSRLVGWIKDLATGYSRKVTNATQALLESGRSSTARGAERSALFGDVRRVTHQLSGHRGNVAKAFNQRLSQQLNIVPQDQLLPDVGAAKIAVTKPTVAETSLPKLKLNLVAVTDRETGVSRAPTNAEKANWQYASDVETRSFRENSFSKNVSDSKAQSSDEAWAAAFKKDAWAPRDFALKAEDYLPADPNIDLALREVVQRLDKREHQSGYEVGQSFKSRDDASVPATPHFVERLKIPARDVDLDGNDPFSQVLQDLGFDRELAEQGWFAKPYSERLTVALQNAATLGDVTRAEATLIAAQTAEAVIREELAEVGLPGFKSSILRSDGGIQPETLNAAQIRFNDHVRERRVTEDSIDWVVATFSQDQSAKGIVTERLGALVDMPQEEAAEWLAQVFINRFEGAVANGSLNPMLFEPGALA